MARGIENYGLPMFVNRAFLPLAIEAGVVNRIKIIASENALGVTDLTLIEGLAAWLDSQGETLLANSLNRDTLRLIINYMVENGQGTLNYADALPSLLDENGPAATDATRDGNTITGTYTQEPAGYTAELYVDNTFIKDISGGSFTQQTGGVPVETLRVLYRNDTSGGITRFGPEVLL